jgi:hypothetical protein
MSKTYHALWLLCLGLFSCGSGEAVTEDFGEGYQGGYEPPPATQRGQSTPPPNLSECPECYSGCIACLDHARETDADVLICLNSPECEAYFASQAASMPEYGVTDDNIFDAPSEDPPPEDCSEITDYCLLCECYFGEGAEECVEC